MKTIVQGNQDYLKFFSASDDSDDTVFRSSCYVLRQEIQEGTLLCSTLTGELVLLSSEEKMCFDKLPQRESAVLADLIRHRFVVPLSCKEDQTVDQLRMLMQKRRAAKKVINQFNILTTTFCNARCFYCYESEIRHVHMSEKTALQLVDFIEAHHGGHNVKIGWYGGEPMIGKQCIDQICEALNARNIVFESGMTSNGYLFDEETVKHAKDAWKLKSIQITLDGTEDIYNRTKAYVGIKDNPYQRVMQNIRFFLDAGIYVDIRMNLDTHNSDNLETLIRELSDRFPDKKFLHVYVSRLNEEDGFIPVHHSEDEEMFLNRQLISLQAYLESCGWPQYGMSQLPALCVNSCLADNPCKVQCTPDGILSKCIDQIYDHTIGNVSDGIIEPDIVRWWQERSAFKGCSECLLYPSCFRLLKHCPVKKKCSEYQFAHIVARYKEVMVEEYRKWKQSQA